MIGDVYCPAVLSAHAEEKTQMHAVNSEGDFGKQQSGDEEVTQEDQEAHGATLPHMCSA